MGDHVIDTNVLLVASAHHEASSFKDTHVPLAERKDVFDWLSRFSADPERLMVLDIDEDHGIAHEYTRKLSTQDFGFQVYFEKLNTARLVLLEYDHEGYALVPDGLAKLDKSDKKMAAAVLADREDGGNSTLVNACDTDWHEHEVALREHNIHVEQLIPEWCLGEYKRKHPSRFPTAKKGGRKHKMPGK